MKNLARKIQGFIYYRMGVLEKIFYYKTYKNLLRFYESHCSREIKSRKTLIYMMDGKAYSGGITDVFKGIVSMYKLSKQLDLDFRINFCFPFSLDQYLVPNKCNWHISETDINYCRKNVGALWFYSVHTHFFRTREFEMEFQSKIVDKFFSRNKNKREFHVYTNCEWAQGAEYAKLFNELFRPSLKFDRIISAHLNILGPNYCSSTFRFQQSLGDFSDSGESDVAIKKVSDNFNLSRYAEKQLRAFTGDFKDRKISKVLSIKDRRVLIENCLRELELIYKDLGSAGKILVTADSATFLSEAKALPYTYIVSEGVSKSFGDSEDTFDLYLKPFLDIFLLANAEKLYLLYSNGLYRSAFARYASYLHDKKYEERRMD